MARRHAMNRMLLGTMFCAALAAAGCYGGAYGIGASAEFSYPYPVYYRAYPYGYYGAVYAPYAGYPYYAAPYYSPYYRYGYYSPYSWYGYYSPYAWYPAAGWWGSYPYSRHIGGGRPPYRGR